MLSKIKLQKRKHSRSTPQKNIREKAIKKIRSYKN